MKNNIQPIFKYSLGEPGSSLATLSYNGEEVEFELVNVCNPLGDLLEGLVTMITTPSHLWGEENVCRVVWYGESSTYNWVITHLDDINCRVSITESVDFFGDDTESDLIEFECEFLDLISSVVTELDGFIKGMGLLNYTQLWQKDVFPITQFLFLKKTLIDNNKWLYAENKKCILSDELQLLLS